MRTIQLKLFHAVLKHEIIENNKKAFYQKLNYCSFTNINLSEIFENFLVY